MRALVGLLAALLAASQHANPLRRKGRQRNVGLLAMLAAFERMYPRDTKKAPLEKNRGKTANKPTYIHTYTYKPLLLLGFGVLAPQPT
jgi:hypothetical protein